jgi:hypothetical protein
LHLIAEADDGTAFARGVQRLLSRVAMAVNALAMRTGSVWRDRHHREPLTTPSQVRNALVYVLFNDRKHELTTPNPSVAALQAADECSSARWFHDWSPRAPAPPGLLASAGPPLVFAPLTWLARKGWKRRGLLRFDELPRP